MWHENVEDRIVWAIVEILNEKFHLCLYRREDRSWFYGVYGRPPGRPRWKVEVHPEYIEAFYYNELPNYESTTVNYRFETCDPECFTKLEELFST